MKNIYVKSKLKLFVLLMIFNMQLKTGVFNS